MSNLPIDATARKAVPMATGALDYFPDAIAAVAECSLAGNKQHIPGEPLKWVRGKSADHADALVRHLVDRGKRDSDGMRHSAKVAWRALALLQEEIERDSLPLYKITFLTGEKMPGWGSYWRQYAGMQNTVFPAGFPGDNQTREKI